MRTCRNDDNYNNGGSTIDNDNDTCHDYGPCHNVNDPTCVFYYDDAARRDYYDKRRAALDFTDDTPLDDYDDEYDPADA